MKKAYSSFSRIKAGRLIGFSGIVAFLLFSVLSFIKLKQSPRSCIPPFNADEKPERPHNIASSSGKQNSTIIASKIQEANKMRRSDSRIQQTYQQLNYTVVDSSQPSNKNIKTQEGRVDCDLSEERSDTCSMFGDIRIVSSSYTVLLLSLSSQLPLPLKNNTHTIKPYARKWEPQSMQRIRELVLTTASTAQKNSLNCTISQSVPAIVFSTGGGFLGNFFHDFTDVLIPLFVTARQFNKNVQFLVADFNAGWINRYRQILQALSHYDIINMDKEESIRCFPNVHVGLKSHKVLGIDPTKTPNGYSMSDFKEFLKEVFSLGRSSIIQKKLRKKPRLLMLLRKGSRSITNEKEVITMARRIGYMVIAVRPEGMKDLKTFAGIVNSCDVMMGVHGAGLTNMVFLPENSTLIQIIPVGGLTWACRHDFGEPAPEMGIKYLEYEIEEDESSLIKEYPRDHAVFKNPLSIHKQGWNQLWSIYLDKQKVKLNVKRLKGLLKEVYLSFKQ